MITTKVHTIYDSKTKQKIKQFTKTFSEFSEYNTYKLFIITQYFIYISLVTHNLRLVLYFFSLFSRKIDSEDL